MKNIRNFVLSAILMMTGLALSAQVTKETKPIAADSSIKALETKLKMAHEHIPGPGQNDTDIKNWLADIKKWRELKLAEMKYSGAEYDRPELKWC